MNHSKLTQSIKYLSPQNLHEQLKHLTKGMSVTKGTFELLVENCTLADIEWNHMDQMHRPTIHNTYEKGVRIATGENFAVSLTEWSRWPFLINVTDVYLAKGLFYQSLTLAGILFVHSIISMETKGDNVLLKDEWYIASRNWFKFLHQPLNKKLHRLNVRLQQEDEQVRQGRFFLRKKGYQFRTDVPNYYNSNLLSTNTLYPNLPADSYIDLSDITAERSVKTVGAVDFIVTRSANHSVNIWPAVCPHEGGPLMEGQQCERKITCPWHGLQFSAVELTDANPKGARYGFAYTLANNKVYVEQNDVKELISLSKKEA